MTSSFLKQTLLKGAQALPSRLLGNFTDEYSAPNGDIYRLPPFLWRGDSGQGKWICSGHFSTLGQHITFNNDPWHDDAIMRHLFWGPYTSGFSFLPDLRALGGDAARLKARMLVKSWIITERRSKTKIINSGQTGRRLSNWLLNYDFFGQTAPDDFIALITGSILRQANALSKFPQKHIPAKDTLACAKGLIFTGLCITDQEKTLERGLEFLEIALKEHISHDGGHISRSPQTLLEWACDTMDIYHLMQRCHFYNADYVPAALDRMASALRFFSQHHETLPFFHGTYHPEDTKLKQFFRVYDNNKSRKAPLSLPNSGYERMKAGKTSLIIDCGSVPSFKYNTANHAGLAAFELFLGKEKLITNCGSHALSQDWANSLKYTAAHSTLILDDRNSCEILPDGHIGRAPETPFITRRTLASKAEFLEISHNGYMPSLATTHTRRIEMEQDGKTIQGIDILTSELHRPAPLEYTIRFHLHPMVQASLIKNSTEVLLRLPSGKGANFNAYGLGLRLEDSLMIGKDLAPRKSKQIVIEGRFSGGVEQCHWHLTIKA